MVVQGAGFESFESAGDHEAEAQEAQEAEKAQEASHSSLAPREVASGDVWWLSFESSSYC